MAAMWADFLPLVAFFVCYKFYGVYSATALLIVLTLLTTAQKFRRERKIDPLPLFGLVLLVVLGGLTVYLKDPRFLMWKPTIAYLAMAAFFALSCRSQQPMLQRMLESQLRLSPSQWKSATLVWSAFFTVAAGLNLVVAYNFSLDLWIRYKVFGTMVLTLGFILAHTAWLKDRQLPEPQN